MSTHNKLSIFDAIFSALTLICGVLYFCNIGLPPTLYAYLLTLTTCGIYFVIRAINILIYKKHYNWLSFASFIIALVPLGFYTYYGIDAIKHSFYIYSSRDPYNPLAFVQGGILILSSLTLLATLICKWFFRKNKNKPEITIFRKERIPTLINIGIAILIYIFISLAYLHDLYPPYDENKIWMTIGVFIFAIAAIKSMWFFISKNKYFSYSDVFANVAIILEGVYMLYFCFTHDGYEEWLFFFDVLFYKEELANIIMSLSFITTVLTFVGTIYISLLPKKATKTIK